MESVNIPIFHIQTIVHNMKPPLLVICSHFNISVPQKTTRINLLKFYKLLRHYFQEKKFQTIFVCLTRRQ